MKKIVQMNDFCVIEIRKEANKTEGGLFLPDQVEENRGEGVVVSCPECDGVAVGDHVLFPVSLSYTVESQGKKFAMVKVSDILAKVKEEE